MSRRKDPCRKKPLEVLEDILDGHREANTFGPQNACKYLERVVSENKSLPNASKFFIYDLLCEAYAATANLSQCEACFELARKYLEAAQEEAPRHFKEYKPSIRYFERGIGALVDTGRFEEALVLCEEALALNMGPVYEAKAHSLRRMV